MEKWVSIHWWYVTTALIPVGLLPPLPSKKKVLEIRAIVR